MTMTIPFLSFFKKVKDQAMAKKERPAAGAEAGGAAREAEQRTLQQDRDAERDAHVGTAGSI